MATARDFDSRLLRALRAASPDERLPVAALVVALGADEPTLRTHLDGLHSAGYQIETTAGGCRFIAAPPHLIAADLCASLPENTAGIGRQILVFAETDSTNDLAAQAGRDGVPGGLVILAESQRAGRGRLGRRWTAPPYHALLMSALLRPPALPPGRWSELTFCAALAVAETAEEVTGQAARIKWPNDVLLAGRKIAGILLESHPGGPDGFVVVGIGLNVLQAPEDFPLELRERAGSLAMFSPPGQTLERRAVAATVLRRLDAITARCASDFPQIMAECARRGCLPPLEETVSSSL